MENAFPLLRLPNPDQQRVLRCLHHCDQLTFSVLSKNTKSLLHSLKIKIESVILNVKNPIELTLTFPDHNAQSHLLLNYVEEFKSVERAPEDACFKVYWAGGNRKNSTFKCHLTLRNWIIHILHCYHGAQIQSLEFFNDSVVYDLTSIRSALQGIEITIVCFWNMNNEELFKKFTKIFITTKRLTIDRNYQPEDTKHLQVILFSNFDFFGVFAARFRYYSTLDRLLSINASTLLVWSHTITDKTINRLLKLWIKGAMPRLRHLVMNFESGMTVLKKSVIMNGIEGNENQERIGIFECARGSLKLVVMGGLTIMRFDGVEATIKLEERGDDVVFLEFYVWN